MSNTNQTYTDPIADEEKFVSALSLASAAIQANEEEETEEQPKKKYVGARLLAFFLAVLSVLAFALAPVKVLTGAFKVENATALNAFMSLFSDNPNGTIFEAIPTLTESGLLGNLAGVSLYLLVGCTFICVILGIIALFNSNNAQMLCRTVCWFFTMAWTQYAICNLVSVKANGGAFKTGLDIVSIAIAAVAFIIYATLALKKVGKRAWTSVLQVVFSLIVEVVFVIALALSADKIETAYAGAKGSLLKYGLIAISAMMFIALAIVVGRLQSEKGYGACIFAYVLELLATVGFYALFFLAGILMPLGLSTYFPIACIVIAILQLILVGSQQKKYKLSLIVEEVVEETPVVVEEEAQPAEPLYEIEEVVEAVPYEGGPVAGVEIAQEVNPVKLVNPAQPSSTAGYDFYNCQSFDPFIATLDTDERNQFTDLFILKQKGVMPEIPDYVVGGDNREFFRKIFIYIGQYRSRLPDGLLSKIYQFSIKIS